jgi:hypothetical protein
MMCNMKTMLKVGFGMLVIAGLAYYSLPDLRTWIVGASPFLLFLICPITLLIAMKMMTGQNCDSPRSDRTDSAGDTAQRIDK